MGKKVLVVDDDPDVRLFSVTVLEEHGYTPLEAANGEEGLKMIKEKKPDLIILDLILPGTDGYLGVLPGHAPLLTGLNAGAVEFRIEDGEVAGLGAILSEIVSLRWRARQQPHRTQDRIQQATHHGVSLWAGTGRSIAI